MNPLPGTPGYRWLLSYKIASTFTQFYLMSLIGTNGSSNEPFLALVTIAHAAALVAGLRAIDALIDPMFQALNPFKKLAPDTLRAIADDTEAHPDAEAVLSKIEKNTAATAENTDGEKK